MKELMDKLIDSLQTAFIKGRQIINMVLIANKVVDFRSAKEPRNPM